jgi:hypothetical protein
MVYDWTNLVGSLFGAGISFFLAVRLVLYREKRIYIRINNRRKNYV